MYNKKNFYFYELICIFNCIVVILHCIINHIKFYIMKKFLFLFASMMLLGGNLVTAATTENSSTAKAENATEVVTLHLNFTVGDRIVYFSCPEWNQYGINEINVYIHNVDVYQWDGTGPDYNTTAWVQLALNPESEVAPVVVKPESYVAIDEIEVVGPVGYTFDFVITGIPAW